MAPTVVDHCEENFLLILQHRNYTKQECPSLSP